LLAVFAWLALVSMPMHGGAPVTASIMPAAMPAMQAMATMRHASVDCPHADTMAHSQKPMNCCCDSSGAHGALASCHCAATFGTALAASNMIELLPMVPEAVRPPSGHASAPNIPDGPPLRPPAV